MALLQRSRRCGRARVRDNGLKKITGAVPNFFQGELRSCSKSREHVFFSAQLQSCVGLDMVLHLWAPMQDSGRLRLQSNSTMQARYC